MAAQHSYPQGGGGAAGRGAVLVIVAIALGVLLLARGFDGGGDPGSDTVASASPANSGDDGAPAESPVEAGDNPGDDSADPVDEPAPVVVTTSSSTLPPPVTHPANEVKVAAVNGKGAPGLASAAATALNALGYATKAKNAVNFGMEQSVIYYQVEYADDAKAIAAALSAPADILTPAPATVLTLIKNPSDVSDFNIFIVLAADDRIPLAV